ncbi:PHP domain-containing protein [Candidatus Sumerlaeota bacterium]|nr:PHP domain-containing protein [Candidatus Sumerlaeota bacterium]
MGSSALPFVHLGARSDVSLGESIATVKELCWEAARDEQPLLALTDVNSLANAPAFAVAAHHAGIRPVFGAELTVLPDGEERFRGVAFRTRVLVESEKGWQNLVRLVNSARAAETKTRPPHIPMSALWQDARGLIFLLGGARGELTHFARERAYEKIEKQLEQAINAAGIDRVFLELHSARDGVATETIVAVAGFYGLRTVAVPMVRCAQDADEYVLRFFEGARTPEGIPPRTLADLEKCGEESTTLLSRGKVVERFPRHGDAVAATLEVAQRCSAFSLPVHERQFPVHDFTRGVDADSYIWNTAFTRAAERYGDLPTRYKERLNREFKDIVEAELANAIVSLVRLDEELESEGVQRGPGAGLLTNSVIASLLGLTRLDPLKFDLPFEITPGLSKGSFPLMQLSIPANQEVGAANALRALFDKQVVMVGEWKAWKCGPVMDWIAELLGRGGKWASTMMRSDAFTQERERVAEQPATYLPDVTLAMESVEVVAWLAQRMEGRARAISPAQSVYTFSVDALDTTIPCRVVHGSRGEAVTAVSEWGSEELGRHRLGRIEFLHAPLLDLIGEATAIVREQGEEHYFPERVASDDGATYRLLAAGLSAGIEALESPAVRRKLRQGQPADLHSLIRLLVSTDRKRSEDTLDLGTILLCHVAAAIKASRPLPFYAAALGQASGNPRRMALLLEEVRQRGIQLLNVDVNYSDARWSVERDALRAGFDAVRVMTAAASRDIIAARKEMHFSSLTDFCNRTDRHRLKPHQVRALMKAAAFDGLGTVRGELQQQLDEIFPRASARRAADGDAGFFDREAGWWTRETAPDDGENVIVPEAHAEDLAAQQVESCGFALHDEVTREEERFFKGARIVEADRIHQKLNLQVTTLAGMITLVQDDPGARGSVLLDVDGCLVRARGAAAKLLASDGYVGKRALCTGMLTREAFQWIMDAESVCLLEEALLLSERTTSLSLDLSNTPESALKPLVALLKAFPGKSQVSMQWMPVRQARVHHAIAERGVLLCPLLQQGLDTLVGATAWRADDTPRERQSRAEVMISMLGRRVPVLQRLLPGKKSAA